MIAAVDSGAVQLGIALDEDTMLTVQDDGGLTVSGRGQARVVRSAGASVSVTSFRSAAFSL